MNVQFYEQVRTLLRGALKFALLGVATVGLVACAEPMAKDGKQLSQQSAETQAMFRGQWGDQAPQRWAEEHDANIDAQRRASPTPFPTWTPAPSPTPVVLGAVALDLPTTLGELQDSIRGDSPSWEVAITQSQCHLNHERFSARPPSPSPSAFVQVAVEATVYCPDGRAVRSEDEVIDVRIDTSFGGSLRRIHIHEPRTQLMADLKSRYRLTEDDFSETSIAGAWDTFRVIVPKGVGRADGFDLSFDIDRSSRAVKHVSLSDRRFTVRLVP